MNIQQIDNIIRTALAEDLPGGDVTAEAIFSPRDKARAVFRGVAFSARKFATVRA